MTTMPSEDPRIRHLADRYDDDADGYVDHWAPVLHPMSCALLDRLPPHPATRILDVGAGTGLLLNELRARFSNCRVVGIDRSAGMLRHGHGSRSVMDAHFLGFRSETYDLAIMAFVLFHVPDPITALREVHRVLNPGGLTALITWESDAISVGNEVWDTTLDEFGAIPASELPRVARHDWVDTPEKMNALLSNAGFASVECESHEFTHSISREDFARLKLTVGSAKQRLESLAPAERERFVDEVERRLRALAKSDLDFRMPVLFTFGRKREARS